MTEGQYDFKPGDRVKFVGLFPRMWETVGTILNGPHHNAGAFFVVTVQWDALNPRVERYAKDLHPSQVEKIT